MHRVHGIIVGLGFICSVLTAPNSLAQSPQPAQSDEKPIIEDPAQQEVQNEPSRLKKAVDQTRGAINAGAETLHQTLAETRLRRQTLGYFFLGSYSPVDMWIPSKYGATLGLAKNADRTWEFEYLRGTFAVPFLVGDLGKISDERFSLIRRHYLGTNSFNLHYGLTYFDFSLHIGDDLLNKLTNRQYPSIDLVAIEALGINLGFGNRWVFKHNITFGVDWFSMAQPIYLTKKEHAFLDQATNPEDRKDVDRLIRLVAWMPRLTLFKVQLGISF